MPKEGEELGFFQGSLHVKGKSSVEEETDGEKEDRWSG